VLTRGGGPNGRAFQNSTNYIFTMYSLEMKRKIGGAAWASQRKNLCESTISEAEAAPIVGNINRLYSFLGNNNLREFVPNVENDSLNIRKASKEEVIQEEMENLIKRLIPYSRNLQGTPM
jgi:phospholipase C